jgi:hypothetical protein
MKKLFIVLFITIYGCAPHMHQYSLIKSNNEIDIDVRIACMLSEKTFLIKSIKNDSIKLCSKIFDNKCVLMDSPDSIMKYHHKKFKINDRKFHKLFNNDTLELHIFNDNKDTRLLYKSILDSYSK